MICYFFKYKGERNRMRITILLLITNLFLGVNIYSQNNSVNIQSDSLQNKTYKELSTLFYKNKNKKDTLKAKYYAQVYLLKAKQKNDTIETANGFLLFSRLSNLNLQLKYCDSIINLTKKLNHQRFPTMGYFRKGLYLFHNKKFKRSLDLHLEAYNHARKNNQDLAYRINHNIGILRVRLGDHKKALEVFKSSYKFSLNNDHKNTDNINYLKTIFSLSNQFRRNHILDSAMYYCKLGIKESIHLNNSIYHDFLLTKGILDFNNQHYVNAILNITKAKEFYEKNKGNNPNLAFAYFYKGKIQLDQNKTSKAIKNFKKVDSIFELQQDIHPEIKGGYKFIIDFYKKKGNKDVQLKYIEKLIKVDSVLDNNYKYINKKINKEYDTPLLLSEKQKLINELHNKQQWSFYQKTFLVTIIIIIGGLLIYNFRKKVAYKQKFNLLIQESSSSNIKNTAKPTSINAENIGLSQQLVDKILLDLDVFVKNKDYLNKNITIIELAKKLGTNAKYLSKVINAYKQKNFTNYINDLRVNYAINKLKDDKQFRNYTIKAISEEVGYKKAESFSKAFNKKTGINPSYFIKQLSK